MADFVTHTLFGERVVSDLPAVAQRVFHLHPAAFYWGLQGPDLLFFRKALFGSGPLYKYASMMHGEKNTELFTCMLQYIDALDGQEKQTALSYFYGFLCHYALDSEIHPYVYCRQYELAEKYPAVSGSALHCQIETDIDSVLYTRLKKEPITSFSPEKLYAIPKEECDIVAKIYTHVLKNVYGQSVPYEQIVKCFSDTLTIQKLLFSGSKAVFAATKGIDALMRSKNLVSSHVKGKEPKWDCLNLKHAAWYNPYLPEKKRKESVLGILTIAGQKAISLAKKYTRQLEQHDFQSPIILTETFSNGDLRRDGPGKTKTKE
ncbi:MAG TPA: zinc dependent phospholipase C family protein [Firmicutes bacterium]|nr:zinc dependent phospholipase C family protein [Bacillota bacterium]